MALTDEQKTHIRFYLKYPEIERTNSPLESAMDALGSSGETLVILILTHIDNIWGTLLPGSWGRQKVVKAEEVTLAGADEILALRAEGKRLCNDLADTLGVPLLGTPFSSGDRSYAY